MTALPFYDAQWPLVDKTLFYFSDTEEGDVQEVLKEHEIRNIYRLFDVSPIDRRIFTRQCLCFLLDHAPTYTTDREEISYFLLRSHLMKQVRHPERFHAEMERASLSVDFMDMFRQSQAVFNALLYQQDFEAHTHDPRATDIVRVEVIVSLENEISNGVSNPIAHVPRRMAIIEKLEGSTNTGITNHFGSLQDRLIDLYGTAFSPPKPSRGPVPS